MGFLNFLISALEEKYPEDPRECLSLFKTGNQGDKRRSQKQYQLISRAMSAGIREAKILFLDAFVWETSNAEIVDEVKNIIKKAFDEDDKEVKLWYAGQLMYGYGVVRNTTQADSIYLELANKGVAKAAYEVGVKCLRNDNYDGAISWLKKANLSDFKVNLLDFKVHETLGDAYMRGMSLESRENQELLSYYKTGLLGFDEEIKDKPSVDDIRAALQHYRNSFYYHSTFFKNPDFHVLFKISDCIRILGFENKSLKEEFIQNLILASENNHFEATFALACIFNENTIVSKNSSIAIKYAKLAITIHKNSINIFSSDSFGSHEARRVVSIRYLNEIIKPNG